MSEATTLQQLLVCPRCDRKSPDRTDRGLHCPGCGNDYDKLDNVPWLFAEPGAALEEWRSKMHMALRRIEHGIAGQSAALETAGLLEATRARIESARKIDTDHLAKLSDILQPLALKQRTAQISTYLALRTRPPTDQGILSYYSNVHRDWCWGDRENDATAQIVLDDLPQTPGAKILVLGAGAGRLAYDIHEKSSAAITVGLDFNPLLMLLAERISRGTPVQLYEYPIAPRDAGCRGLLRTLAAPSPAREGLHYVLADTGRLPFRRHCFDAVVTPWLIDIVPEPLGQLAHRVNDLLTKDGRWINFGSLSFSDADPLHCYGPDECQAILEQTGFSQARLKDHCVPYMCSPDSRHARTETILAWNAVKSKDLKRPEKPSALPQWLVRGEEAVPASDSFNTQAMATRVHAFIMSLIDGKRSIRDIAEAVVKAGILSQEEAEPAIRTFFIRMLDESRRTGI